VHTKNPCILYARFNQISLVIFYFLFSLCVLWPNLIDLTILNSGGKAPTQEHPKMVSMFVAASLALLVCNLFTARAFTLRPLLSRTSATYTMSKQASSQSKSKWSTVLYSSSSPSPKTATVKKALRPLARYLEVESWRGGEDQKTLEPVLASVANACRQISKLVSRAATDDIYGKANGDEENIQGEVQQKLDVICNRIMMNCFCGCSDTVAAVASEEEDEPRPCSSLLQSQAFSLGDYVAVFDPLDGSKNIDQSLPVGTIFGIYKYRTHGPAGLSTFLQKGNELVASGYCLYSATTILVLTMGGGRVDGFTLDPDRGEFMQTHPDMRIPSSGPIVSFNEANFREWPKPVRQYLHNVKMSGMKDQTRMSSEDGTKRPTVRPKSFKASCRYVGAMVADVHNVLCQGGVYGYPSTANNINGKLRLLYEVSE